MTAPGSHATMAPSSSAQTPGAGMPPCPRRKRLRPNRERAFWAFLGPALGLYTGFMVLPSLFGVWVSLQKWAGPGDIMTWRGFANYQAVLTNEAFRGSFVNTLVLAAIGGIAVFGISFLAMAVLREAAGRAFIRAVVFLPIIISLIAVGVAIGFLLNPNGVVNQILGWFGIPAQPWLGPQLVFACIIAGFVWSSAGFYVALLMSAVDSIPQSLYEDSELAGATKLQKFWYVTLPLSWDVFSVAAVLWVVNSLKVFEIVIAFTSGGAHTSPPLQARTVAVQQFLSIGDTNMGAGAAMGVVLMIVTAVLVLLVRRVTRRESVELA